MELKKCPFCGGEGKIIENKFKHENKPTFYTLMCKNHKCGLLITLAFESKDEAAKAWNHRAN